MELSTEKNNIQVEFICADIEPNDNAPFCCPTISIFSKIDNRNRHFKITKFDKSFKDMLSIMASCRRTKVIELNKNKFKVILINDEHS